MRCPVHFDDKPCSNAGEIGDVRPNGMLPAKSHFAKPKTKLRPKKRFGAGQSSPENAGAKKRFRRDVGHAGSRFMRAAE
jgi:hypothetical protein